MPTSKHTSPSSSESRKRLKSCDNILSDQSHKDLDAKLQHFAGKDIESKWVTVSPSHFWPNSLGMPNVWISSTQTVVLLKSALMLVEEQPEVYTKLKDAFNLGSYKEIRNLGR